MIATAAVARDLAPTGVLRSSMNLGNPVLAQGTPQDVDRPGIRVGVKRGSAYDLFLTRTLRDATIVRGEEGVEEFRLHRLEVAAGIRQPMTAFVAANPDVRLIGERFMQIQQAVGTTRTRQPQTVQYLRELVEELKATGFVAQALRRSGQLDATVARAA